MTRITSMGKNCLAAVLILISATQHAKAENNDIDCQSNLVSIVDYLDEIQAVVPQNDDSALKNQLLPQEEQLLRKEAAQTSDEIKKILLNNTGVKDKLEGAPGFAARHAGSERRSPL